MEEVGDVVKYLWWEAGVGHRGFRLEAKVVLASYPDQTAEHEVNLAQVPRVLGEKSTEERLYCSLKRVERTANGIRRID